MITYAFEARDAAGRIVRGNERAIDEMHLDGVLRDRDLLLVKVRATRRAARGKANARVLIDYCYHLATAIEAGLPLLQSLRDLQDGGASAIANELEDIARRIESGQQLSEAMEAHPGLFPELVRSLVAAGEETGNLDLVLHRLTVYLEWREDMRRKIVSAATYPCIVVAGLIGLVVLLLTVVLPNFLEIFVELDVELPLATRALVALEGFSSTYGLHVLAALAVVSVAGVLYVRTESGRYRFDELSLHVPAIGKLLSMIEMSRLAHNLGLLYSAGIPINRCLQLVSSIVQNRAVRSLVVEAQERVLQGGTLTASLARGDLMPAMVGRMIALGESSGSLDRSLEHVATFFDREVPERIDRMIAFVNTAVVLGLGAILGTIALAIFLPLYQMMANLNG